MKNFLFILVTLIPLYIFANDKDNNTIEKGTVNEISNDNLLATLDISVNDLTCPWVISVPAPPQSVNAIYGPCAANYATWTVNNGILTISYARDNAYLDMYDGGTFIIYVQTSTQTYHIKVNVSL